MHCSDPRDSLNFASSLAFLAISFYTLQCTKGQSFDHGKKLKYSEVYNQEAQLFALSAMYIGMSPIVNHHHS